MFSDQWTGAFLELSNLLRVTYIFAQANSNLRYVLLLVYGCIATAHCNPPSLIEYNKCGERHLFHVLGRYWLDSIVSNVHAQRSHLFTAYYRYKRRLLMAVHFGTWRPWHNETKTNEFIEKNLARYHTAIDASAMRAPCGGQRIRIRNVCRSVEWLCCKWKMTVWVLTVMWRCECYRWGHSRKLKWRRWMRRTFSRIKMRRQTHRRAGRKFFV